MHLWALQVVLGVPTWREFQGAWSPCKSRSHKLLWALWKKMNEERNGGKGETYRFQKHSLFCSTKLSNTFRPFLAFGPSRTTARWVMIDWLRDREGRVTSKSITEKGSMAGGGDSNALGGRVWGGVRARGKRVYGLVGNGCVIDGYVWKEGDQICRIMIRIRTVTRIRTHKSNNKPKKKFESALGKCGRKWVTKEAQVGNDMLSVVINATKTVLKKLVLPSKKQNLWK